MFIWLPNKFPETHLWTSLLRGFYRRDITFHLDVSKPLITLLDTGYIRQYYNYCCVNYKYIKIW